MIKNKFTRADIQMVLTAAGMDAGKARDITIGIIKAMSGALAACKVIELRGLGSFEVRERKARIYRNPRNGQPVETPAGQRIIFKPGRELKAVVKCTRTHEAASL